MKRIMDVLKILFIIVVPFVTTAQIQANLLVNGDFEKFDKEIGVPNGWVFLQGQTSEVLHIDKDVKKSGEASLRFDIIPTKNVCWIGQWIYNIHPDTEYKISGYIKVESGSEIGTPLEIEPNLGGTKLPVSDTWTYWEFVFNTQGANLLLPQFRFRGVGNNLAGRCWLDDIKLEQVSKPGEKVLPERLEVIKLLKYQSNPVSPEANTKEWTKPYMSEKTDEGVFKEIDTDVVPSWEVGQWSRYLCEDNLLVPSQSPEKKQHISLIDCAIIGKEKVDNKSYFWYQCVIRMKRYWVGKALGLKEGETEEKILLERDRKAVLTFLVNGPDFKDIRRYQLQVDDEPLLEYTDGEKAVLPRLNIDHAVIKPVIGKDKLISNVVSNKKVPVTGIVSLEYHGAQLDREVRLINWEDEGAKDERRGEIIQIKLRNKPHYVHVAFDGFGELRQFKEMVNAGVDIFVSMPFLYLGEAKKYLNEMPAYFYNTRRWDVDIFDICRSNFLGFSPILDEFYQRQRKLNEYVKQDEAKSLTQVATLYSKAISRYISSLVIWPGEQIIDYNSPSSACWYSARAGSPIFILENARLSTELSDIERITGKKNARELADEINIAFMAGAERKFGIKWGQGIYRWVPREYWKEDIVYYAERGAEHVGFWIENTEFYDDLIKRMPDIVSGIRNTKVKQRKATTVIVVPNGYVVGLSGSPVTMPFGVIDFPEGKSITEEVIKKSAELYDNGIIFDIVIDDPDYPPDLKSYKQVIKIGF